MFSMLDTLLRRYTQGVLKEHVSPAEVLLASEVMKLAFSGYMTMNDKDPSDAQGRGAAKLVWLTLNSAKMLVLALIYAAMNVLSVIISAHSALNNLSSLSNSRHPSQCYLLLNGSRSY
jgi:hypothetical protein